MKVRLKKIIFYGKNSQQFGQLYKTKDKKNSPVVIVIHGGYWQDNHCLDSYATSSIVDYLQAFDVAIWNLEYRRMDSIGKNIKAPWPTTFKDVADGIEHLHTIKHKESLDLSRILLIGHSAGGHLATWVACRNMIPQDSMLYHKAPLHISRVISIAGILNLSSCDDLDQPEQVERLMGGNFLSNPKRYQTCDPYFLSNTKTSLTIVHGEKDTCVLASQAEKYFENSQGNTKLIIFPDADHFSMLPHDGNWIETQWQKIKQLIAQQIVCLG